MSGRVTMREIADRAQVSLGTVSHVVNGTATVRPKLKARVMEAIRSLGFQPSALAQGLRQNRIRMLGMIVPDITNPFFPAVVRGAEDVAFRDSYRLVLCNTDNDPAKEALYVRELRSYRAAGLLIIPAAGSDVVSELGEIPQESQPVVCVDRCPEGWKGDGVVTDGETGAYDAPRYLIEFHHRELAVITGPSEVPNSIQRLRGFQRAVDEAGIKIRAEFIQAAAFDTSSGYQAGKRLLSMTPHPTAIFACNDMMALGVLHALQELGLRCPEDVSLVGFDNLEFCEYTRPALTSVYQPGYEMGAAAARLLLNRIAGSQDPPQRIALSTEVKLRNSVRTPPRSATISIETSKVPSKKVRKFARAK